jgi:heme exporter protein CcmD
MAETTGYMVLGYALTALILIGLVGYLALKRRNLEAELKTLQQLDETGEVPANKRESVTT